MSEFTWNPFDASRKTVTPRVKTSRFGDGYQQRVGDGINTALEVWDCTFGPRDSETIDDIEAFLLAQAGVSSFTWSFRPGKSFVCPRWTRGYTGVVLNTITATFEEVPE
jgi:phage-related protein